MAISWSKAGRVVVQALAILALTAGLTEVAFRIVDQVRPLYIFPDDTYNRFRARPHADVFGTPTNSHGFRDEAFTFSKPAGTYRILGIGDSFVFSVVPYEHNFLTVLENELRRSRGAVEVYNMGIPRNGVNDYLALLRTEGLRFAPDMVLVCFFMGNDMIPEQRQSRREGSWVDRSYLLTFLRFLLRVLPAYEGEAYRTTRRDDAAPTLSPKAYGEVLARRIELFRRERPSFVPHLPRMVGYLEQIRELCRQWDIELRVVVIPEEMQVDPTVRELVPGYRAAEFDFELPNVALRAELEKLEIPYLDLLARFREETATEKVYKPRDTHWNIRGNRIAATAIHAWLAADPALAR